MEWLKFLVVEKKDKKRIKGPKWIQSYCNTNLKQLKVNSMNMYHCKINEGYKDEYSYIKYPMEHHITHEYKACNCGRDVQIEEIYTSYDITDTNDGLFELEESIIEPYTCHCMRDEQNAYDDYLDELQEELAAELYAEMNDGTECM